MIAAPLSFAARRPCAASARTPPAAHLQRACSSTRISTRSRCKIGSARDPLVRPDLPGRLRPVRLAGRAARAASRGSPREGWMRRDVEDLLFYGVLGVVLGGRLGYVLFYKPRLLRRPPARDLRGLEGRHVLPRRAAGRARRDGAVRAAAQAPVPRGHRPDRALRAARPGVAGASATSSTASCGAALADPIAAVGDGVPAVGLDVPRHPVAALPVPARRAAAVRAAVARTRRKRARRAARSPALFLIGYGVLPLHRRILPRARRLPRPARARHEHGPVAVRADDRWPAW